MVIIKKSGKKEAFSADKMKASILAASEEAGQPLPDSDLRRLLAEFQQIVSGKDLITTQQMDVIINGLLYSKGYYGALEHYVSYNKKK